MAATSFALHDPENYAHRYVESADAFRIIRLERSEHSAMPFLIDEYLGAARETQDVAVTLPVPFSFLWFNFADSCA
jgi:hypothetical protein